MVRTPGAWTEETNPMRNDAVYTLTHDTGVMLYIVRRRDSLSGEEYAARIDNPDWSDVDEISIGPDLPIGPFDSKPQAIQQTIQWANSIDETTLGAPSDHTEDEAEETDDPDPLRHMFD